MLYVFLVPFFLVPASFWFNQLFRFVGRGCWGNVASVARQEEKYRRIREVKVGLSLRAADVLVRGPQFWGRLWIHVHFTSGSK